MKLAIHNSLFSLFHRTMSLYIDVKMFRFTSHFANHFLNFSDNLQCCESWGNLPVEFNWLSVDSIQFTFGLSACRVKPRRLRGRRGFTRQPENSKRSHLSPPALQTPAKFHKKTPRERQQERKWGGRGEKKREILGPPPFGVVRGPTLRGPHPSAHPSGPSPFGALTFSGFGLPPFGAATIWGRTDCETTKTLILAKNGKLVLAQIGRARNTIFQPKMDWPKLDWPKLVLAQIGRAQNTMAQNGLAKIGLARIGQIRMDKNGLAKNGLSRPVFPPCVSLEVLTTSTRRYHGRTLIRPSPPGCATPPARVFAHHAGSGPSRIRRSHLLQPCLVPFFLNCSFRFRYFHCLRDRTNIFARDCGGSVN